MMKVRLLVRGLKFMFLLFNLEKFYVEDINH